MAVATRSNGRGTPVEEQGGGVLSVSAPNFKVATAQIIGTSPLMLHRFNKKVELMAKHQAGSRANRGKSDKAPRDFEADYEGARYRDKKAGWDGFDAARIRNPPTSAFPPGAGRMRQG